MTKRRLLVVLDSRRGHAWLLPLLRAFNDRKVRLPWLDNRVIAIGFIVPRRSRSAAPPVPEYGIGL
jgi:hypothetical protein